VSETPETEQVTVRRAPKFPAFMIVGGGIGALVTYVLTSLFPADPTVGFGALFAYFALFGVTAGVVLGALLALILDRRATRRASTATAERESVEAPRDNEIEE
jgi:hypothetical protein